MWRRLPSSDDRDTRVAPWARRARRPWERLGCSGPLFVLIIVNVVLTLGVMIWAAQRIITDQEQTTRLNITNASIFSDTHVLSKRNVRNGDFECTAELIRSATLCTPLNATNTVILTWGVLGSPGGGYGTHICHTNITTPLAVLSTRQVLSTSDPRLGSIIITSGLNPPTVDDSILMTSGVSGFSNNWLLLTEEAGKAARTDCVVCMGARPLLRIVPAALPVNCVFPVMKFNNPTQNCSSWDKVYPLVKGRQAPIFSSDVAEGNFTCVNMTLGPPDLGTVPPHWCNSTYFPNSPLTVVTRADVWWWCGGKQLFGRFPKNSTGLCALVSLLLPISVYPIGVTELVAQFEKDAFPSKKKRMAGSDGGDPTYIDAIGVPRGVPDEYKLANQVSAGIESSICWWCTINKNVDRINYIHFNVQRLGNWTQQGFEAVHGQLAATSLMAFQNRIAVDMLLAEKGGVCSMFGEQCCTFIPNNTASDGSLTVALEGLRTLNGKMKSHSGIDTSMWDSWMSAFGKYKTLVSSILVSISVFAAILVLCGCCCIPCIRSLTTRVISRAIDPSPLSQMFPLLANDLPEFEDEVESAY
uniref:Envelope protein n=1 Tax=Oncorhynchus mykiss TaxID=8022 RepID=A0A8K9V7S8_ONCMY